MREEHSPWGELAETVHPRLVGGKRPFETLELGMASQVIRCEVGCEVVCLAGKDQSAVALPDRQRLVTVGVARGRDDPYSWPDLGFSGDLFIGGAREVDKFVDAGLRMKCRAGAVMYSA